MSRAEPVTLVMRRFPGPLAWALCGLSLALLALGVALLARDWGLAFPTSIFAVRGAAGLVGSVFAAVGLVLTTRRPHNPIGWYFSVAGLCEIFQFAAMEYVGSAVFGGARVPLLGPMTSLQTWVWLPAVVLCSTFTFLRYPDGRLLSRRWGVVERLAVVAAMVFCAGLALAPGPVTNLGTVPNPYSAPVGRQVTVLGVVPTVGFVAVAAVSLVLRSRRGSATERAQVKWLAYAACVVGVFTAPTIIASGFPILSHVVTKTLQDLLIASVGTIPIAVTFAVLRYRLYDIDRLVSRTVSYSLVTGLLFGVYFGVVAFATQVLPLSGSVSTAASVLVAAALFTPLRRRVQHAVDRRFNRTRYNAAATVEAFAHRLREQTDLGSVRNDLIAVAGQTVEPATISVWMPVAQAREGRARPNAAGT